MQHLRTHLRQTTVVDALSRVSVNHRLQQLRQFRLQVVRRWRWEGREAQASPPQPDDTCSRSSTLTVLLELFTERMSKTKGQHYLQRGNVR